LLFLSFFGCSYIFPQKRKATNLTISPTWRCGKKKSYGPQLVATDESPFAVRRSLSGAVATSKSIIKENHDKSHHNCGAASNPGRVPLFLFFIKIYGPK